jgi:hypothetical protein
MNMTPGTFNTKDTKDTKECQSSVDLCVLGVDSASALAL